MFADWFIPFAFIIGGALTIGLLFLKPRNLDQELQDRAHDWTTCTCYGCRQEWADKQK